MIKQRVVGDSIIEKKFKILRASIILGNVMKYSEYTVVIVGSGAAGLYAAGG